MKNYFFSLYNHITELECDREKLRLYTENVLKKINLSRTGKVDLDELFRLCFDETNSLFQNYKNYVPLKSDILHDMFKECICNAIITFYTLQLDSHTVIAAKAFKEYHHTAKPVLFAGVLKTFV